MKRSLFLLTLAATLSAPALAQPVTVSVEISGVRNSEGVIFGSLCAEGDGPFPGPCLTYTGMGKAEQGTTSLGFFLVNPGRYALLVFHDEDGDVKPDISREGLAYGNNITGRPTFDGAAIVVAGPTTVSVAMRYPPAAASKE